MCSFREEQFGISKIFQTNSTLPYSVKQYSNSDVEDNTFDVQQRNVRLNKKAIN